MPEQTTRRRAAAPRAHRRGRYLSALLAAAAVAAVLLPAGAGAQQAPAATARANPFAGTGMWIWQVPRANGGSPAAIAARAKRHGIDFVVIKAAHGASYWGQFSPSLVAALKARGLRVCGYQRMLGSNPRGEAAQAARAVAAGADCFVIDAESEYANKSAQARTYITALRARVGASYPLGFTSYPYVSLHRSVPYGVFLGQGGAQYNLPQVYWKAIGDPPTAALARTYRENRGFGRPIVPIGQAYYRPPSAQIRAFKAAARRYGASGVSWWSWQHAGEDQFRALADR